MPAIPAHFTGHHAAAYFSQVCPHIGFVCHKPLVVLEYLLPLAQPLQNKNKGLTSSGQTLA
jgi:hypothetical protein